MGLLVASAIVVVHGAVAADATGLWLDEAYTLGAVNRLGDSLRGTHGTMGLYYAFMAAWGQLGTATWWLRVPSILFALGTLAVLRPVARRIGGSDLVLVALPLLALGPMFEWKATEVRSYSLETLIVCVTWYVLLRAMDAERFEPRWYLALVPLAVAGVFCHGLFVVFLVPIGLIALAGPRPWRAAIWLLPAAVAAGGIVALLHANGAADIGTNISGGADVLIGSVLDAFLTRSLIPRLVLSQFIVFGIALAVRRALRSSTPTDRAVALIPASWAVVPCVTLALLRAYDPVFNPRYLAPVGPAIALLVAATALALDRRLRGSRPAVRAATLAGPASVVVVAAMAVALVRADPYVDEDWRAAARLVAARVEPGDGIVFANLSTKEAVQHRPPFEAAWRETPHDLAPEAVSPARPLGEVRRFDTPLPLEQLGPAALAHRRLWIVENQETGNDTTSTIAAIPAVRTQFRLVDRWQVHQHLVLTLYERRP